MDHRLVYLTAGTEEYLAALHDIFTPGWDRRNGLANEVRALLYNVGRRGLSLKPLVAAYDGLRRIAACLGIGSPGASAMVFITPRAIGEPVASSALQDALVEVRTHLLACGNRLVQGLAVPTDARLSDLFSRAGFRRLTQLIYLKAKPRLDVNVGIASDIDWVAYTPKVASLFERMIGETYAGSLDCPELHSIRNLSDVLAGHRSAGEFLPECWWVALRQGTPLGMILLNGIPDAAELEVVYMGVAQPARGQGVADRLLERATACAAAKSATHLALAVDARNAPARRVYARWGFAETGAQDAWIATPVHT